jgi:gliding motility-associated lipoprotein GldB
MINYLFYVHVNTESIRKPLTLSRKNSTLNRNKETLRRIVDFDCKPLILLFIYMLSAGCEENGKQVSDAVLNTPVEIRLNRFDVAFDQMETEGLPALKANYPYLFPEQYPDSIWLAKHRDSLQREIRAEVRQAFSNFKPLTAELEILFKHIRYYFPEESLPEITTLTNDVDYHNRVILTDSLLLISLDNYLGADHRFYSNMDRYIAKELDSRYLSSDVATAFARRWVPFPAERSFIAQMIYYGKILYLKDLLLPLASDAVKIGYDDAELQWALDNEGQIWRYFIERELLYNTDRELAPRFLDPAPFSKFRLLLDNESPGRLGRYMGWQIVRSYMETNEVPLEKMLGLSGEELFKNSNYKPPK